MCVAKAKEKEIKHLLKYKHIDFAALTTIEAFALSVINNQKQIQKDLLTAGFNVN